MRAACEQPADSLRTACGRGQRCLSTTHPARAHRPYIETRPSPMHARRACCAWASVQVAQRSPVDVPGGGRHYTRAQLKRSCHMWCRPPPRCCSRGRKSDDWTDALLNRPWHCPCPLPYCIYITSEHSVKRLDYLLYTNGELSMSNADTHVPVPLMHPS